MDFAVLMSVYCKDRAEWFDSAIESVAKQDYRPKQIVVVVDGPVTDELEAVLAKWKNELSNMFEIVRLERNMGLGIALEEGMKHCTTEYVARMDSDDLSVHDRFMRQCNYILTHPEVDVLGGQIEEFNSETGEIVGIRSVPCEGNDILGYLKRRCPFNHMSVIMKKSSVLLAGGYQDWPYNEDYSLWLRMAKYGAVFANLPEVLVNVRVNPALFKRRGGIKYFKSEYGIQKELLNSGLIRPSRFLLNVFERFIIQIMLPNSVRSFAYRVFARKQSL